MRHVVRVYEPVRSGSDACPRLPGPRATRLPVLHGADRRAVPRRVRGLARRRRSPCSRCSTSSATPSLPVGPARRPRSRSTSWPATPRTRADEPLSRTAPRPASPSPARHPHHELGCSCCYVMGVNPFDAISRGQHRRRRCRLVGRSRDRRVQPDPGAAARRRQRRDVGCSTTSPRAGPARSMIYASVAVTIGAADRVRVQRPVPGLRGLRRAAAA